MPQVRSLSAPIKNMSFIHKIFLTILPYMARLHPSNWKEYRWVYPQLWWCMPRRWVETEEFYPNGQKKLRRAKPRLVIEHICGFLTGHEISGTELGYGGGNMMDRNCRWCDKSISIPKSENCVSGIYKNLMDQMDHF
jgi:hypothetical protein